MGPRTAQDQDGQTWAGSHIDFVPVELIGQPAVSSDSLAVVESALEPVREAGLGEAGPPVTAGAEGSWTERTSLFGEPEG